ncbi:PREDICTED: carbon catabolite repressor protein 4 homolog 1-like [Branchiostoma belcheri]|uniref:Carbon catabolite repressor protein 4 homolog 1-like n=1 Tax=Branchiostoma belcheri TaxID=7741 RepID=A0A6P4Y5C5_BRABE|nr:PREDICTED: carbon catabolite repressor protein 4 homolog 1-like [Branchiostoma belcheri]
MDPLTEVSSEAFLNRKVLHHPHNHADTDGTKTSHFSVVSYNILADCHVSPQSYPYCPKECLPMSAREKQLDTELRYLNGDIVCLQEVGTTYFQENLLPLMQKQGYDGYRFKEKVLGTPEGIAMFFRTSRFSVVDFTAFDFNSKFKELIKRYVGESERDYVYKYLEKTSVMMMCRLRCKVTGRVVTVGTFHVIWWLGLIPSAPQHVEVDVQSLQISVAMAELVQFAGGTDQPHILCGDFNSSPFSPAYGILTRGHLAGGGYEMFHALRPFKVSDNESKCLIDLLPSSLYSHPSKSLKSAYAEVKGKEPDFTNYMDSFVECLDYIWYSSDSVRVTAVLDMVPESAITPLTACPNKVFPSDHLSLKAVFQLTDL